MVYVDYDYYSGTYMGTRSEEEFPRLAIRASSFLDYYTQNRAAAAADTDALKMACCALVDQYGLIEAAKVSSQQAADGAGIQSESVGSYSVTHRGAADAAADVQALEAYLPNVARQYLAHTGLLYRGGCR